MLSGLQGEISCFDGIKSKIIKGQTLLKDLITYRNPGDGIPHKLSHKVLGKKAKFDIPEDTLLKINMFE